MTEHVLVCHRIIDLPDPSVLSVVAQCDVCGARIWVADSSPKQIDGTICIPCWQFAVSKTGIAEIQPPTRQQLNDILNRK